MGICLIVVGVSILGYGMGQTTNCIGGGRYGGCGNIPELVGVLMTAVGLATLGGVVAYGVRVWEGSDSALPED